MASPVQIVTGDSESPVATGNPLAVGGCLAQGSTTANQTGSLVMGAASTSNPTYTDAKTNPLSLSTRGGLRVEGSWPNSTSTAAPNGIGVVLYETTGGVLRNWRSNVNAAGHTTAKPDTTGGLTPARVITGTTGVIKASAGQGYRLWLLSTNAAVRYLHLYNKASAPTLSTDTPVMSFPLTQNAPVNIDLGGDIGTAFSAGIAWAYTTDNVAIPTTAGTSGELQMTALYA